MAGWIFAIIGIAVAYLALAVFVLPRLLFRAKYAVSAPADRGIKKIKDDDEPALVFEPSDRNKAHIKKYAVAEKDGKRMLIIKLAHETQYIDYDIVVFNAADKAERAFNVKEAVKGAECTRAVELPGNTEYVSVIINEVDGVKYRSGVFKNVAAWRIALFMLLSAACTFAAVFGIKVCLAYMGAGIFFESFTLKPYSITVTCIIAAVAVAFDIVITVVAFLMRRAIGSDKNE